LPSGGMLRLAPRMARTATDQAFGPWPEAKPAMWLGRQQRQYTVV
jgi:hypothetical protein